MVPYFAEGLKSNEACIWTTSEPLEVEEATAALEQAVPTSIGVSKTGSFSFLPSLHGVVLSKTGRFDIDRVCRRGLKKSKRH